MPPAPSPPEPGAYLRALNRAFPGWGDEAEFDWWFRRRAGDLAPDVLAIGPPDAPMAGMAVVYRRLVDPWGGEHRAGVICGAWTEPGHRLRGLGLELYAQVRPLAIERGVAALLAFIRNDRVSIAHMQKSSVATLPAWSLAFDGAAAPPPRPAPPELRDWFDAHRRGGGFRYPGAAFADQARLAAPTTAVVRAGDDAWAVLDRRRERPALSALVAERALDADETAAALAAAGAAEAYTSDPDVAEAAQARGATAGGATVFVVESPGFAPEAWSSGRWSFQALDKA
jgi:hypothetical protein